MKAFASTLITVATTLMIAAIPVLAQEGWIGPQEETVDRNECVLVARNCPTDSIQDRIQRIQGEINRGRDVYTRDELRRLNDELQEARKLLEYEMTNGGA